MKCLKILVTTLFLFSLVFSAAIAQETSTLNDSQYSLGAGDLVLITVFGQEDLTVETRLSNIGTIRYPFLGDIKLVGKSVNQVEAMIDEGLRGDYLIDPSVSVTVLEYRPFFIDGEVNRPGGYPYQPGLSFDRAVALAGGYTERANKNQVALRRIVNGKEIQLELKTGETVLPGDIITIPSRFF